MPEHKIDPDQVFSMKGAILPGAETAPDVAFLMGVANMTRHQMQQVLMRLDELEAEVELLKQGRVIEETPMPDHDELYGEEEDGG